MALGQTILNSPSITWQTAGNARSFWPRLNLEIAQKGQVLSLWDNPRIQALESELRHWLDYFERHPGERFVSDDRLRLDRRIDLRRLLTSFVHPNLS